MKTADDVDGLAFVNSVLEVATSLLVALDTSDLEAEAEAEIFEAEALDAEGLRADAREADSPETDALDLDACNEAETCVADGDWEMLVTAALDDAKLATSTLTWLVEDATLVVLTSLVALASLL